VDLIADSLGQMAAVREVHARKEEQWEGKWPYGHHTHNHTTKEWVQLFTVGGKEGRALTR